MTWYGPGFFGNRTANGTIYTRKHRGVAGPPQIPLNTLVRITRLDTGQTVAVLVTDRMAALSPNRFDASYAVASELDLLEIGVVHVRVDVLRLGPEPWGQRPGPEARQPARRGRP